jgi:hypothetical protein
MFIINVGSTCNGGFVNPQICKINNYSDVNGLNKSDYETEMFFLKEENIERIKIFESEKEAQIYIKETWSI